MSKLIEKYDSAYSNPGISIFSVKRLNSKYILVIKLNEGIFCHSFANFDRDFGDTWYENKDNPTSNSDLPCSIGVISKFWLI